MKNSQGLDINKIAELQFAFGQIYDENFKPRDKTIYSKEINSFNEKLNEIGIDSKLTPKQIELKLQQLYEILIKVPKFADQTPNDKIKEAPRPEAQTANTVSEKGNEQIFRDLEKRNEELKKTREEAKRVVQNAKIRQKEIYKEKEKLRASEIENEQKQIESDIQEAQNVQKELENKKIYAKITVPAIPELTQEEKQDLQILEDFAKDPKTRTQLIEDLTQEIEGRIKPTLKEATENEIRIIARTSAVDIVEKIANPEARQKAQEENIQTAVYQSLTTNPKVIKEVVKEAKPLQALEKGSVVLAYYANEQNATTQIIAGNLFDSKFKRIFYGPNFKEIRVEYSEKLIQGQTNYIVDIGSVNSEFINLQQKSNTLLEKLKSFGIEESRSYISTQVGIYFKEKVATMPESVVKKVYSSPVLQSFLSKYGIAEPVVWQAIGQNQVVGILMKVTPETAGPVLSIAGKALGIEIVKPITTQIAKEAGKEVVVQATKEVGKKAASGAIAKVIGTAVGPFSAIPVVGPILNWLFAEIVVRGLGELWSKFKVWWSKNKENIAPFLAVGAGLSLARFGIGPAILGGAGTFLMFRGTASALLFGPLRFFAILGRNIGITIATPVIVTLLIIPPLVAFIMLVINNSAYVVPPSPYSSSMGRADNPYMLVKKTANPSKLKNSNSNQTVIYVVSIEALKGNLTNLKLVSTECKVIKKDKTKVECPPEYLDDLEGAEVVPGNVGAFSFTGIYDSKYSDSLIYDKVTISATNEAGEEVVTSGSASVCIGDCPRGCFEISDDNEVWQPNYSSTLTTAIAELTSKFPSFVDKACSGEPVVKLCYTTKDPSPIGDSLCVGNIFAIHKHTPGGCDINFNQCSLDGDPKDAFFLLTHELSHHIQKIDGGDMINRYENAGAHRELPLCTYSGTNGNSYEGSAEANALYATGGVASFSTCSTNFQSQYPLNYRYSSEYMNNP